MTGAGLPSMIVVPSIVDSNGFVCATECAYHPAPRHATTISDEAREGDERAAIAPQAPAASAHGLRPTTRAVWPTSPATATSDTGGRPGPGPLLDPGLIQDHVELRAPDVVPDALRREVDQARVEQHGLRRRRP